MEDDYVILKNLNHSIDTLESAILAAIETLSRKPISPKLEEAFKRLDEYLIIVDKQRDGIPVMLDMIQSKQWTGLHQCINRTNALSAMIRDDARELLLELKDPAAIHDRSEPN